MNPFHRFADYDFRYWVSIQEEDGNVSGIHALLAHRGHHGRNSWFEARERRNELSGYLADLEVAHSLALSRAARQSKDRAENIGLQSRYALIRALIENVSKKYGPELIVRYLQAGIWSRDQALTWARINPDRQITVKGLANVLQSDDARDRDEIARLVLEIGAEISDPDNRLVSISGIAEHLPLHFLRQALEIVAQETNEGSRLGGLKNLLPKLPSHIRAEALEVAKSIRDPILRTEAISVVAAHLDESHRTAAFGLWLEEAYALLESSDDRSLMRLPSNWIPLDWLEKFEQRLDHDRHADTRESILLERIQRLSNNPPEWIREQARGLSSWRREEAMILATDAFMAKGKCANAIETASEVSTFTWNRSIDNLVRILQKTPRSEWDYWRNLLREVSTDKLVVLLRQLSALDQVPGDILRELTEIPQNKFDRQQARSAIARILTPTEIEALWHESLQETDSLRSRMLVDLAQYLSLSQIYVALDRIGEPNYSDRDGFRSLIFRSAELGNPDEAIGRVAKLSNIVESVRAEVLTGLAQHIPDRELFAIRDAIRPDSVAVERVRARTALLAWVPWERANEVITEALSLKEPLEQVRVLSEILPQLKSHLLGDAIRYLQSGLQALIPSVTNRDFMGLEQGFRALSQALNQYPSSQLTQESIALAKSAQFSPHGQLILLLDIASSGGTGRHVYDSLETAVQLLHQNPDLASVSSGFSADCGAVLGNLLAEIVEPQQLTEFLLAFAHLLDRTGAQLAARHISDILEVRVRLMATEALLPHLIQEDRRQLIADELTKESEWLEDAELLVVAVGVLSPYAPECSSIYGERALASFRQLSPEHQIAWAGRLGKATNLLHLLIEQGLAATEQLANSQKPHAIAYLAPFLDAPDIDQALALLAGRADDDCFWPLVRLAERAAVLDDVAAIFKCLSPVEKNHASQFVEEIAGTLSIRAIRAIRSRLEARREFRDYIPLASPEALGALAVRATELDDEETAMTFLDEKGNNTSSRENALERIYGIAPRSWTKKLIDRSKKLFPSDRAIALANLLNRAPKKERQSLVESILKDARHLGDETRIEVMHKLEAELNRLPKSVILTAWTEAMHSPNPERGKVLADVRAFASTLVKHFGVEVASTLDDAIRLGAVDLWP